LAGSIRCEEEKALLAIKRGIEERDYHAKASKAAVLLTIEAGKPQAALRRCLLAREGAKIACF
jgi:hypothetical protein